ncbi:hypothetical protein BT69DRAFT_1375352 [Atractiella rhizophila]|nr:hypothetical protein BT69DRAFT_1375352 [Atractiella rhizophila]
MSPFQEAVISLLECGSANPSVGGPVDSAPSTSTSSLDLYADEPSVKATGGLVKPPTPDLLVKSKTGTGKTVTFLIPAIESRIKCLSLQAEAYRAAHPGANQKEVDAHIRKFASESTGTLNLSPTRELATQIANEAIKLCSHLPRFLVQLLVRGTNKRLQEGGISSLLLLGE